MLHLNKNIIVYPQGLNEDEIREQLKQYEVGKIVNGHEVLSINKFFLLVPTEKNINEYKTISIFSVAKTYKERYIINGIIKERIIRTHYNESQVQKFLGIIEQYGAILKIV